MGNDSGLIVFSLFIGSINQALAKLTTLTAQLGPQKPIRYAEMGGLKLPDPWVLCFAAFFLGGEGCCLFVWSITQPIIWSSDFLKARNPTTPTGAALCDREAYLCSLAKYGDTIVTIHFQGQIYGPGWDSQVFLFMGKNTCFSGIWDSTKCWGENYLWA